MEEFCGGLGNAPQSEKGKKIADRWEFEEARGKGQVDWGNKERIIEGDVDGCREMGNRGVEEESENAIGGSQLGSLQYKLTQGNESYSCASTKKIIEKEMPGMRREMPKGELITVAGVSEYNVLRVKIVFL